MSYELRVRGHVEGRYETAEQAEARAREITQSDADCMLEIFDLSTGRPYAPGASAGDREALSRKIGF